MTESYPDTRQERNDWIVGRRPARNQLDPRKPHSFLVEPERSESGRRVQVATVFLTSRECPWRCLMCDLWKNTLPESVPAGAIPDQIDFALRQMRTEMPPAGRLGSPMGTQAADFSPPKTGERPHIKLYNSGSFFDPGAIPPDDYPAIAAQLRGFERVIVECHPAFLGDRVLRFRDLLWKEASARLEVAMGLETAHPGVLERLNKGMTLGQFRRAAAFLRAAEVALRVFILVQPPFLSAAEGLTWANRSLDLAFEVGATVASLIPTRAGNGALEALAAHGLFTPARLTTLEAAAEYGIGQARARVFVDLWDLEKFSGCPSCFAARAERLRGMNLDQVIPGRIQCAACG